MLTDICETDEVLLEHAGCLDDDTEFFYKAAFLALRPRDKETATQVTLSSSVEESLDSITLDALPCVLLRPFQGIVANILITVMACRKSKTTAQQGKTGASIISRLEATTPSVESLAKQVIGTTVPISIVFPMELAKSVSSVFWDAVVQCGLGLLQASCDGNISEFYILVTNRF